MKDPQTMREALVAELIGDIDALLARAETLRTSLPTIAENAATTVGTAGETAAQRIASSGERVRAELVRDVADLLKSVQTAAGQVEGAARVVGRSGHRFALLALVSGLAGGVCSGILAGLLAARYILGV